MTSTHVESRHFVTNIERFEEILGNLKFEKLKEFKVTDYLYIPKGKKYDLSMQQMKIRVREDKTLLIYREYEWIDKAKTDYFKISNELEFEEAVRTLKNWNFEKIFEFCRKGTRYKKDEIIVSLERIDYIGDMIEIEAPSIEIIDKTINELDFISDKISKSVPALVFEKVGKYDYDINSGTTNR
jgi:adenylate cyclase class IV